MHLLLFFLLLFGLSGSFAIMGPKVMRGPERGSLTVRCHYGPGWKTHRKWWCRGADWTSCKILVITTGSEQEVKRGRVSIRDDQRNLTFTVTMEELRRDDADTYWCGIERTGTDLGFQVKVTIDPAPTTASTTTAMSTAPVTPEETRVSPTVTSHHSESSVSLKLSVLIPLIFAVLLLLSVAASLLAWRMVKQREKAPEISQEQALQPLESDVCYANLTLQHTGTSSGPSRKKASRKPSYSAQVDQVEGDYVTMVCTWWGCCGAWNQTHHCPPFEDGLSLARVGAEEESGCWEKPQPLIDLPVEVPHAFGFWKCLLTRYQHWGLRDRSNVAFVLGRGDPDKPSDLLLGSHGKRVALAWSSGCLAEWREGELEDLGVDFRSPEGSILTASPEASSTGGHSLLPASLSQVHLCCRTPF
ncbi:CMRF35-like molecule 1 isoform X2 [Equus quagga]|uniref:CMRF35-like molecule 1 isoform X2 n=1 Tax=Equus quagga TaxID=89248 RepID=UPI001EE1A3AC|nr:CMRF35-like molecule 1 isoform X2 [Equus quagga]